MNNVRRLTGFSVGETGEETAFPDLFIEPGAQEALLIDGKGRVRLALAGHTALSCQPYVNTDALRLLAKRAGVHLYTPENSIVYGDGRITGVFSIGTLRCELSMVEKGTWRELIFGQRFADTDRIPLDMPPKAARVFLREDL